MASEKRARSKSTLLLAVTLLSSFDSFVNGFHMSKLRNADGVRQVSTVSFLATSKRPHHAQFSSIHMIPHGYDPVLLTDPMATSAFHLSAVEVFDGSSIVDPVVVSSNFWSGLQKQILSVILGQFIASVVFAILVAVLGPQLVAFRDMVLAKLTKNDGSGNTSTIGDGNGNGISAPSNNFIKADSIVRPAPNFGKLILCLLIDIVGSASEALPIVGEFTDVLSAPVLGFILQNLYPGSSKFVFVFEFAEEILPLTDFIPFATICWVVDTYYPDSTMAELFQLGNYNGEVITAAERAESYDTSVERIRQDLDDKRYK
mmetsp:Transcript_18298/g.41979  ORF Transcript_18298/g.41979 Transcript_18298/m.41979 type:complete len:316 (-) Transcript_18298:579-1526(-)